MSGTWWQVPSLPEPAARLHLRVSCWNAHVAGLSCWLLSASQGALGHRPLRLRGVGNPLCPAFPVAFASPRHGALDVKPVAARARAQAARGTPWPPIGVFPRAVANTSAPALDLGVLHRAKAAVRADRFWMEAGRRNPPEAKVHEWEQSLAMGLRPGLPPTPHGSTRLGVLGASAPTYGGGSARTQLRLRPPLPSTTAPPPLGTPLFPRLQGSPFLPESTPPPRPVPPCLPPRSPARILMGGCAVFNFYLVVDKSRISTQPQNPPPSLIMDLTSDVSANTPPLTHKLTEHLLRAVAPGARAERVPQLGTSTAWEPRRLRSPPSPAPLRPCDLPGLAHSSCLMRECGHMTEVTRQPALPGGTRPSHGGVTEDSSVWSLGNNLDLPAGCSEETGASRKPEPSPTPRPPPAAHTKLCSTCSLMPLPGPKAGVGTLRHREGQRVAQSPPAQI